MPFLPEPLPPHPEAVTPGAENKPQIVKTDSGIHSFFIPTATGHDNIKEPPKFPSK